MYKTIINLIIYPEPELFRLYGPKCNKTRWRLYHFYIAFTLKLRSKELINRQLDEFIIKLILGA